MLDLLFLVLMQTCNIVKLPFCLMSAINFFTAETWIHLPFGINLVTLISFVFANFCQPVFLFLNYCKWVASMVSHLISGSPKHHPIYLLQQVANR